MSNQNEEILLHFQKCQNLKMHGREGIKFPLQIFILGDVLSSYYTFPLDVIFLMLMHDWNCISLLNDDMIVRGIFVQMLL